MYQVAKRIHFCYGHRLLKHKGKCAHLHGHNAVAEITCSSENLSADNMVVDFDDIASKVGDWIDKTLDHRMILNKADKLVFVLKDWKEPFMEMDDDPTAEAIAQLIYNRAKSQNLPVTSVTLQETPSASATFS